MDQPTLTLQAVQEALARMAGLQPEDLRRAENPAALLQAVEDALQSRIIGQPQILTPLLGALRSRLLRGLEDRPQVCLLFVGPSGVGKTETALQLATSFGGSSEALVRVDCSEYSERHSLARLIGAPPGYVGHEQGGMLTEALRRRPRCVVLFDEVEKAAPEVHNLLLQILSAGRLTDGMGNTADFRHACLILTSNLGNRPAALHAVDGGLTSGKDPNTAGLLQAVRAALPVELLGRLDATVPFSRLSVEDLEQIVDLKLQDLAQRVPQVQALTATDAARRWLAEHAWSPDYGARELDRVLRSDLEPLLADVLWSHTGNQAPQRLRVELATPEGPLALLPVEDQTPPGAVQPGADVF